MKRDKYIGMDVHQATTVVAVIDAEGKIVMETIVPTTAAAIRRFIESISGAIHVTLEETTQAEWLHDVLEGLVAEVVVCDPRRNKLLVEGSKGDKADAQKLAELLADGHGPFGLARATEDARLEGVGSRLRNVCAG